VIYLDNAATTPVHPEVLDAMMPYLTEQFGNPGAAYKLGRKAASAVAAARTQVASLLNCKPEQIIFTSGATEANNMVFQGLREHLRATGKTHIITSQTEHKSVLKAVDSLKTKDGFGVTIMAPDNTVYVRPDELNRLVTDETGLVSVMYVNNELGFCNPIHEISSCCRENGVLFHTDCVQAAGYFDLDVDKIGCDFMTISSHKIGGPKGIGALYVRDSSIITPMIYGGDSQEFGLRGGTENVASIVGFGKACEIALRDRNHNVTISRAQYLEFCRSLSKHMFELGYSAGDDYWINETMRREVYKIVSITFSGVDAGTVQLMLDSNNICVSTGSACNSKNNNPSYVLKSIGFSDDEARGTLRISFSPSSKLSDIDLAAKVIAEMVYIVRGGNASGIF